MAVNSLSVYLRFASFCSVIPGGGDVCVWGGDVKVQKSPKRALVLRMVVYLVPCKTSKKWNKMVTQKETLEKVYIQCLIQCIYLGLCS